jgi:hypothetical protein
MIISASRRTDIPAFFSDWFMQRVRAGFFYRVNPFNPRQITGFSLKAADVTAICFWSKNPRPLMEHLEELDRLGLNYYFQFTLNAYGPTFEPNSAPLNTRIRLFQELAERIGAARVIWRYDPVILSSATPVGWHLEQISYIAGLLKTSTHRLIFSFYDFYGPGKGRLYARLKGTDIKLEDIAAPERSTERNLLAKGITTIVTRQGLTPFSCSEEIDLTSFGINHGACIDGGLIRELFGGSPATAKDKNQRPACNCVKAVDMGSYNSCRLGCTYCYANFNPGTIEANLARHCVDSPSLLGSCRAEVKIRTESGGKKAPGTKSSGY